MTDRRGWRFVLEALFLVVLAVALALAKLQALEIAGIMLLGWFVVALLEWAAWRGEPHYGSGLPPRFYVPTVNLPPAQPLEQVQVGYPRGNRDEEATWIAPAALRAEVLGEWPHASPPVPPALEEEPVELPPTLLGDPLPPDPLRAEPLLAEPLLADPLHAGPLLAGPLLPAGLAAPSPPEAAALPEPEAVVLTTQPSAPLESE